MAENMEKEILMACAIMVDPVHVFVICPICGEIHAHGSGGIVGDLGTGHRVAHCANIIHKNINGYVVKITNQTLIDKKPVDTKVNAFRLYRTFWAVHIDALPRSQKATNKQFKEHELTTIAGKAYLEIRSN